MNDHDRAHHPGREPDPDPAPARAGFAAPPAPPIPPGAEDPPLPGAPGPADLDELAGLVYNRISERIGQQPDSSGEMPSVEEAVALRERAPELYDLWLRIAQERAATGNYVQRAPYEVPERLAQSGRPRALSSLVVVLAFCGYLAWLGGPGPYIAGLIALFDLIAMLGLFFGLRPDHLADPRRSARKRLALFGSRRTRETTGQCLASARVTTHPAIRHFCKRAKGPCERALRIAARERLANSAGWRFPPPRHRPAVRPRAAGSATSLLSLLRW